jgi:hypothetical protein
LSIPEKIFVFHTRTLDRGRSEKLRSIYEIRFELALFLELRFSTRIKHRVLIVVHLAAIPRSEPGLSLSLLLCDLLLDRSFLLGRSCRRSDGCRLFLFLIG